MPLYITNGSTSKRMGGYIQSQQASMIPTNASTSGDLTDQNFSKSGVSDLRVTMGVPNSVNSVFEITGQAQLHTDTNPGGHTDAGGYAGLSIQRSTNGGSSFSTIRSHGRWSEGVAHDNDLNTRIQIFFRDRPGTTGSLIYRLCWNAHRQKVYFGRVPSGQTGDTTNLIVYEYDNGEGS